MKVMKHVLARHLLTTLTLLLAPAVVHAQGVPAFEVDATWPKPLPDGWVSGQLGGVCVDAQDNVYLVNRGDITEEEKETSKSAPPIMKFDPAGNLKASWGERNVVPGSIHGCVADRDGNLYVGGNNDGIIQKYGPDGKLRLQIGQRGRFDSADGTSKSAGRNASPEQFFNPAGIAIDPVNGDMYVADGYGNRRIAVFDRDGKFLRQWGRQAAAGEVEAGTPAAFSEVVHCVAMSNAGLIYACDRQGDRVQVFDKTGAFVRNIWIRTGTDKLPDSRGTAWWVAFSPDPEQKLMYVMNGRNEQVHVLDHVSGKILTSFGRPGHQIGNFTHGHTLAVDSKSNVYVAETNWGRRVQKFKPTGQ